MRRASALVLAAVTFGCDGGDAVCEENLGAQTLDERVMVEVGDATVEAELADEDVERDRGWRKRACDREAILLVLDTPGPLPIWGCDLVAPLDVVGAYEGAVVYVERVEPCAAPCGGCPTVGDGVTVDAVLETPAGALEVAVGDPVRRATP
ncbi:MAG: DUF192 domain-containing protein [Myxococcota bacterium]